MTPDQLAHRITQPIVCSACADEVARGEAGAVSLRAYSRLDVGFTERGLQVWCQRHERNVVHIDFGGHRPEADFRCLEPRTSDADRAH